MFKVLTEAAEVVGMMTEARAAGTAAAEVPFSTAKVRNVNFDQNQAKMVSKVRFSSIFVSNN